MNNKIIYINNEKVYTKENNNIISIDKNSFDKKDIITTSIDLQDIIAYSFKLPKTTSEEQLNSEAEIQFYENAGLDLSKNFITFYLHQDLPEEESYLIEAIAIDEEKLTKRINNVLEKIKYIDFISLSIFSFEEFYHLYNKKPQIDAFVYLDNKQSFVTLYKNGKYLYSKTLTSLNNLLKTLKMDYNEFIDVVSKKGLNKEDYSSEETLIAEEIDKFLSDYFMGINNRISYGKNIFYLDKIDNIYFYTPFYIKGIESLKTFWDLSGINFNTLPIEKINLLDKLNLEYNINHYQDEINFSIFERPLPFYKTKSFELAIVVLLSIGIFIGDSGYRYYQNHLLEKKLSYIQSKLHQKQSELSRLDAINQIVNKKLQIYNKQLKTIQTNINNYKKILSKSIQITNIPKTSNDYITISTLLQKNKLKAFSISKTDTNLSIGVFTSNQNRKFIGMFMKDLLDKGYKNIQTNKISTKKDNFYMSFIRFSK